MSHRFLCAVVVIVLSVASARAETAQNVVLSHGADSAIVPLLERAGLRVTSIATSTSLDASVAEVKRALSLLDGPTVLVARGWDGAAASEIGGDPQVSALVFVAAQAPEPGEDFAALAARFPLKAEAAQGAEPVAPMLGKTTVAAWRDRPVFYAVSEQDPALSAELQRFYAARMNAKTIVLDDVAQHSREIAGLILEAAGMKQPACGSEGDDGVSACAAPALPRSLMKGCKCEKGSLEDLTTP